MPRKTKKEEKRSKRTPARTPVRLVCHFCAKKEGIPSYSEREKLAAFISERGRILGRSRSGVCAKHQRKLVRQIKRARHLALLPFVVQV